MYIWFWYIQLLLRILYSSSISYIYQHLIFIIAGQFFRYFPTHEPQKKTRQRQGWDDLCLSWSFRVRHGSKVMKELDYALGRILYATTGRDLDENSADAAVLAG